MIKNRNGDMLTSQDSIEEQMNVENESARRTNEAVSESGSAEDY